jgi:hypothetical protein
VNFIFSKPLKPTSVNASHTSMVFILLSNIDELDRLGNTFTSSTQGLRFWSIITSKPYSSKQLFLNVGLFCKFELIVGSTAIKVFKIIDLIYCKVSAQFKPILSKVASNYRKSHFEDSPPSPSSSEESLFLTNLDVFFLLILKFVKCMNF